MKPSLENIMGNIMHLILSPEAHMMKTSGDSAEPHLKIPLEKLMHLILSSEAHMTTTSYDSVEFYLLILSSEVRMIKTSCDSVEPHLVSIVRILYDSFYKKKEEVFHCKHSLHST
mmetsp:Transcript_27463/g.39330  ORF Transcript_27463/g.39330 Transcript_27463/m.39330 type:complete len:115 (+) Transcript_27463:294-638(+)